MFFNIDKRLPARRFRGRREALWKISEIYLQASISHTDSASFRGVFLICFEAVIQPFDHCN
jgi:hypothetical protein